MYNGKEVTVCIPTLNNYGGCLELIESAEKGSVKPDLYWVIDNGRKFNLSTLEFLGERIRYTFPNKQLALSACWNIFAREVPEIRLILNDDIVFFENTLQVFLDGMVEDKLCYPSGTTTLNVFSFFSLPNNVYQIVGPFDEKFYPAYFEDNDYFYRMQLNGLDVHVVNNCNLIHEGSKTVKNYTHDQLNAHHQQFRANELYYKAKWGGLPTKEIFTTPHNGG